MLLVQFANIILGYRISYQVNGHFQFAISVEMREENVMRVYHLVPAARRTVLSVCIRVDV